MTGTSEWLLNDWSLRSHSTVGGYPIVYILDGHKPLCANCAGNEEISSLIQGINWDNITLSCDECSELIESAYGEPEEEEW